MKILIALAKGQEHRLDIGPVNMSFREAPLTHTTLAALVPDDLNAELTVIDESVSEIPFDKKFDLVAISAMTGTATRAYEIADTFREKGTTVVLGGVHVTLLPDEAAKHADSIVIGFAEQEWPRLLRDFVKKELKPRYTGINVDIKNLPQPRRDLQKTLGYTMPNTVFATRGCRHKCDFCSVYAAGFGFHTRPVGDVINDLKCIKSKRVAFNDVHLTDDSDYAKELLRAMIPLKKIWGGLAATHVVYDDEMLDLLQKSGCKYLLLGFESVENSQLRGMKKGFNNFSEYKTVVEKLHDKGIIIQGCFIFGTDGEDKHTFAKTVDAINELKIDIPRYALYTPYPKTVAFDRLKSEGRLLHTQWEYYDTQHVVIQPDKMSPQELDDGFKWAFRETFKMDSINKRLSGSGLNFYISFVGNLAYRIYIRRLYNDKMRFPEGIDTSITDFVDNYKVS